MRGILVVASSALLVVTSVVEAQSPSFQRGDTPANSAPRSIASADFNRDGWPDLALGGTGRDSISILLNRNETGGGMVRAHEIVVGGGPFDLATGDLNRDGIPDIAIANADADAITLLIGKGDGSFQPPRNHVAPGSPRGVAIADLNRDGLVDIAYTAFTAGVWRVGYGDGAGNFAASSQWYPTSPNPQGIVTGDFNHDGWQDVAVAQGSGRVSVYLLAAYPNYVRRSMTRGVTGWHVLTAGDFNHDGWLDLAAASSSNQVVAFFRGSAGGNFTLYGTALTQSSPRGIEAADLNQDGWLDLVTGDRGASSVTVLVGRSDGSGLFDSIHLPAGQGSRDVVIADLDHDGRADIATANEFGNSTTILHNNTSLVAPAFAFARTAVPSLEFGFPLGSADFNENGRPDIVLPARIVLDGATEATGIGHFDAMATGDFNDDGHVDLVTADFQDRQSPRLLLGDGVGGFTNRGFGPRLPGHIEGLAAGDLNGDGRDDVAVASSDFATGGGIHFLVSGPDGTLVLTATAPAPGSVDIQLVDLNRDGRLDAVQAADNAFVIALGDGRGGIAATRTITHGRMVRDIELGDLDHDGILDLAAAEPTFPNPSVLVFMGTGDGDFTGPATYAATLNPTLAWGIQAVALADLDNDGHLDIFTSIGGLMRGRGDGTMESVVEFDMFSGGVPVVVDFNRDGLLDVAGVMDSQGNSWVAMNRRTTVNRPPAAVLRSDRLEVGYQYFYDSDVEESAIDGWQSSDPDMHALRFDWRDQTGRSLGFYNSMYTPFNPGAHTVSLTVHDMRGGESTDTMELVVRPLKEIVLHTAYESRRFGRWDRFDDESAASAARLAHPNEGAPKRDTALASPADYFEMPFLADPTQEYKLWIRLKAQNNSWANDSVFVQVTGAADGAGNPIYRPGTRSALAVNLEECSGCGVSGWGWEDDGWGAVNRNGVTLRFPQGGLQRIRIQTREDGVSIDQIVLSSERFKTTRPGRAKDDETVHNRLGPDLYFPQER